jgi:hypothetical protein
MDGTGRERRRKVLSGLSHDQKQQGRLGRRQSLTKGEAREDGDKGKGNMIQRGMVGREREVKMRRQVDVVELQGARGRLAWGF